MLRLIITVLAAVGLTLLASYFSAKSGYALLESDQSQFEHGPRKVQAGGSADALLQAFKDEYWPTLFATDTTTQFVLRNHVNFKSNFKGGAPLGVTIQVLASYELYWDGVYIGSNGSPGVDAKTEVEGMYIQSFILPDSLVGPGMHMLALVGSNFKAESKLRYFRSSFGYYQDLIKQPLVFASLIQTLAGIFFIVALYYGFVFLNASREYVHLLFALLSFVFFALIVLEFAKYFYTYPYSWQYKRLLAIEIITLVLNVLLVIFFVMRFKNMPLKHVIPVLVVILALIELDPFFILPAHDHKTLVMSGLGTMLSAVIVLRAVAFKQRGSHMALIGLSPCLVLFVNYDVVLFLGFSTLSFTNLIGLTHDQKRLTASRRNALLQSERLKKELLRKNIKPHFLMNTLTSLVEWVEEDPKVGVEFIMQLADEFKLLSRFAEKKQVSLEEEMALCETHLKVMSYRKRKHYQLEKQQLPMLKKVPPAIFHTLLENGITHASSSTDKLTQVLSYRQTGQEEQFHLLCPGQFDQAFIGRKGTGLGYVEARLAESYGDCWQLDSYITKEGWNTIITIHGTS